VIPWQTIFIAEDDEGRIWKTSAEFSGKSAPEVTIPPGRSARVFATDPILQIDPLVSRKADSDQLEIGLRISGIRGETYQWNEGNPGRFPPGIEVWDESGKIVVNAVLEYG